MAVLRSLQPPEEVHLMPAARSLAVAWECESFLASVLATAAARMAVMRAENWGEVRMCL